MDSRTPARPPPVPVNVPSGPRTPHMPEAEERPFSPTPARENLHTPNRPPSLMFGAPPVAATTSTLGSMGLSLASLPSSSSPYLLSSPDGDYFQAMGKTFSAFGDSPLLRRGFSGEGTQSMTPQMHHERRISTDSVSTTSSSSPQLGTASIMSTLTGEVSTISTPISRDEVFTPPRAESTAPETAPTTPHARALANQPGSARSTTSDRSTRSSSVDVDVGVAFPSSSPRHRTPGTHSKSRLHQPTVIRSTSGRGIMFVPSPVATATVSASPRPASFSGPSGSPLAGLNVARNRTSLPMTATSMTPTSSVSRASSSLAGVLAQASRAPSIPDSLNRLEDPSPLTPTPQIRGKSSKSSLRSVGSQGTLASESGSTRSAGTSHRRSDSQNSQSGYIGRFMATRGTAPSTAVTTTSVSTSLSGTHEVRSREQQRPVRPVGQNLHSHGSLPLPVSSAALTDHSCNRGPEAPVRAETHASRRADTSHITHGPSHDAKHRDSPKRERHTDENEGTVTINDQQHSSAYRALASCSAPSGGVGISGLDGSEKSEKTSPSGSSESAPATSVEDGPADATEILRGSRGIASQAVFISMPKDSVSDSLRASSSSSGSISSPTPERKATRKELTTITSDAVSPVNRSETTGDMHCIHAAQPPLITNDLQSHMSLVSLVTHEPVPRPRSIRRQKSTSPPWIERESDGETEVRTECADDLQKLHEVEDGPSIPSTSAHTSPRKHNGNGIGAEICTLIKPISGFKPSAYEDNIDYTPPYSVRKTRSAYILSDGISESHTHHETAPSSLASSTSSSYTPTKPALTITVAASLASTLPLPFDRRRIEVVLAWSAPEGIWYYVPFAKLIPKWDVHVAGTRASVLTEEQKIVKAFDPFPLALSFVQSIPILGRFAAWL